MPLLDLDKMTSGLSRTWACGVPKSCTMALTWASSCCGLVLVDQASKDLPADADRAPIRFSRRARLYV